LIKNGVMAKKAMGYSNILARFHVEFLMFPDGFCIILFEICVIIIFISYLAEKLIQ